MARTTEKRIWRMKVTLGEVRPTVWRRIEVAGSVTLERLSHSLLDAMGWAGGHLHEFRVGDRAWGVPDPEWDDDRDVIDERRARLSQLAPDVGATFKYAYDFGDGWMHTVKVEAILPRAEGVLYPRCTAGARRCPPEDVGGPWGYQEFLEAMADPTNDHHEELSDWYGGPFDPQAFDLEDVNDLLLNGWRSRVQWRACRSSSAASRPTGRSPSQSRYGTSWGSIRVPKWSSCPWSASSSC